MPDRYWDNVPLFADISDMARGFLEAACNIRYFDQTQKLYAGHGKVVDSWTATHFVRVKPKARHFGECGVAEYVIDTCYSADDLAWMKRQYGMRPIDVQRVPRSGDWHGLLPSEIAEGQHRVIVNLDTLEYLDPARFGQVPTLAGLVSTVPKGPQRADPAEGSERQRGSRGHRRRALCPAVPSQAARRWRHPRQCPGD